MAFDNKTFYPIAHGNGQTTYVYKTADTAVTAAGSGYFNAVAPTLNQGDIILVVGGVGGTMTVDVLVVTSATAAATVTTTNGT